MENASDKVVEIINTHILSAVTFFFLIIFIYENRAVYEIMWKYMTDRVVTGHNVVRHMRIAYSLLASLLVDSFIYYYM